LKLFSVHAQDNILDFLLLTTSNQNRFVKKKESTYQSSKPTEEKGGGRERVLGRTERVEEAVLSWFLGTLSGRTPS